MAKVLMSIKPIYVEKILSGEKNLSFVRPYVSVMYPL